MDNLSNRESSRSRPRGENGKIKRETRRKSWRGRRYGLGGWEGEGGGGIGSKKNNNKE